MDRSYPPVEYGSIVQRVAINVIEEIQATPAKILYGHLGRTCSELEVFGTASSSSNVSILR
jgi:hypothetical protein